MCVTRSAVLISEAEYGTIKSSAGTNLDTALCFVGSNYTFLNVEPVSRK